MKKYLCRFGILLCLPLTAPGLFAQTGNTAALAGTVSDPTGAVVPNVNVTATNTGTNQTRSVTSAADGTYRIPLLEPGSYRIRFTAQGFKTSDVTGITLSVTETANVDRALEVGAQAEQVTVEASVETIQTATSSLGTTVTGQTITSLPLANRNFTQVLGMSTGVAVDVSNGSAFGRGSQNMSVNGASPEKNNFQMDGVGINNAAGNNEAGDAGLYTGIAIPNPDALQEFKIQTSTYDASFGRNPGANVNVVTKSGTNSLHGTLFEYFRNEKLNANDFFYNRDNPASQTTKQVLKNNQFGGVIGGAIKKDKIFFFGSYQGTRQRNGVAAQGQTSTTLFPIPNVNRGTTSLAGVDDAAAQSFRQALARNMCTSAGTTGGIGPVGPGFATRGVPLSCSGRDAFTAANIPVAGINDVTMRLLQVKLPDGSYYIPGSGVTPGGTVNGIAARLFSLPAQYSENQYLANVDYVQSEKHTWQMKYMFSENPAVYQLQGQLPGRIQTDRRGNTSALLRLTSIITPTVVNQVRASFQRVIQDGSDVVPYTAQQIGQRSLTDGACCNGTTGGSYTQPPVISITGGFNVGGGLNPAFAPTNQTQISDNLSLTRGSHTVRVGFEFENVRYPLVYGGLGRGNLTANSFADLLVGRAACDPGNTACSVTTPGNTTGLQGASVFTGCLFCVRSSVNGIIHNYHLRNMSAFFQDDWKVSSNLTLNLGVRWEYNGVLADKYGNLTNFWANDLLAAGTPPSATSTLNAIATLGNNPQAFRGYVVPSNYDSRPISQGGRGPLPPGVRQFDGLFTAQNRVPLGNFGPRIGFAWTPLGGSRLVIRGGAGLFYDRVGINRMVHAVQEGRPYADTTAIQPEISSMQSPFQDRPLTILPRWFNFTTLQGSAFNSPFYDRIQTPLVRQYNLGIQYEFVRGYVFEAAFVGSSGINILNYNHNINTARLASATNPINGITTNTVANASARVPYLGFQPNGFQQNGFDGVYNYNSLQTSVRKNFSRGIGFQGSYTWSKNLSNVGYNAANLNDPTDMWQQYGQTPYSRPHRFVLSYQYDLPFRSSGVIGKFIGGWNLSGFTTIQSGNPLTFTDNRAGTIYGLGFAGSIEQGIPRANMAPGKTYADIATSGNVKDRLGRIGRTDIQRFFNIGTDSAFTAPTYYNPDLTVTTATACPACGTGFGNTGIGIIRGPHQLNFDASLNKETKISENQSLQFRVDFFNIFNHAQFGMFPTNVSATGALGQGAINVNNANFGIITATSVNPRLVQFALRYRF